MNNESSSEIKNRSDKQATTDALLNSAARNAPTLVAMVRASDMKLLFVNEQFEHYLGYTQPDLEGEGVYFTDVLEEYLNDRLEFQLTTVTTDVEARSRYVIYQLKGKTSPPAPFYLYASPVFNEGGLHMYYLVMIPDLSKWDMPFTSFGTRELFLEQFNSEDFGTFEWIIKVDKVFLSIGVYRIYEIEDKNHEISSAFLNTFIHPNDRERVVNETQAAVEGGADLNIEYRVVTAKQNTKIVHCLGRTMKNFEGVPVKFAGSIRDVTEQRFIEEDLKDKVEELNHSNRELEEFAYIASHDLQEPLRKITTFSDRLSEKYKEVLTGDGLMYLSRMIASAENMRSLINDLLEFSRISKTQQPFERVDLNLILRQVKTELELTIEETGTAIESQPLPVVEAIPSQMKQLFVNLVGNAIKFRKPDVKPRITIESTILKEEERLRLELSHSGIYYKITIQDNGIGFEDEYTTRIFQVFQRLHGKAEYPGSGIGLAICKKILEYHHGIIYAENVRDQGARFTFIIPQKQ